MQRTNGLPPNVAQDRHQHAGSEIHTKETCYDAAQEVEHPPAPPCRILQCESRFTTIGVITMLYATRRFEFSAAHRYWRDDWSEERNQQIFGKCTSPYGHGHNYTLDVTIAGTPDPVTGMVINMTDLKAIVGAVLEQFDHKHLNEDTPYFKERIPTTE